MPSRGYLIEERKKALNEGLSLVENAAYLGLPIPVKLRKVLEQLHDQGSRIVSMDCFLP